MNNFIKIKTIAGYIIRTNIYIILVTTILWIMVAIGPLINFILNVDDKVGDGIYTFMFVTLMFTGLTEILLISYKTLIDNVSDKNYRFILYCGSNRQYLVKFNLTFIAIFTIIKLLLNCFFITIFIAYFKKEDIWELYFMLFNIQLNILFVSLLITYLGTFLQNKYKVFKYFLFFALYYLFWITFLSIAAFNDELNNNLLLMIFQYLPLFSLANTIGFDNWVKYLNLIISISGIGLFIFLIIKRNKQLNY
ncbi:hypothetical protein [Spiroplasma culicicola]|uniref:Uncharacterized protein n=1 Tax=Spiroplasma culicicola AES-1 TaxID=1276246 RepID=W6A6L3_9MOLU|nr:hypothetical protein [Spiroplasma culicicola]AHI52611.1 hypothetical protein SCULI_v1c02700 [Spiroplasma culicicola AES-1]